MRKEKLKIYIDNLEQINKELEPKFPQESEFTVDELQEPKLVIEKIYNHLSRTAKDILDKYDIDIETLKIIMCVKEDKETRDTILGPKEGNELLQNIIDIYGENAYDIINCDENSMSNINGILEGEPSAKYKEFYQNALERKCESARDFRELTNILLDTKPEFIKPEIVRNFIAKQEGTIPFNEIESFISETPITAIDGQTVKDLIQKANSISLSDVNNEWFERMQPELFDEEFSKELIDKAEEDSVRKILRLMPKKAKTKEIYEIAIEKQKDAIYDLPEDNAFQQMTDEEYQEWYEKQVMSIMNNKSSEYIMNMLRNLSKKHITPNLCKICAAGIVNISNVESFLKILPKESKTQEVYEILVNNDIRMIKTIPLENINPNITDEEYEKWAEQLIINKIKTEEYSDLVIDSIPRERMSENILFQINESLYNSPNRGWVEKQPTTGLLPIYKRTMELYDKLLEHNMSLATEAQNIPYIDKDIEQIQSEQEREEYKKWKAQFSEEQKEEYRKWYVKTMEELIKKGYENVLNVPREIWTEEMWKSTSNLGIVPVPQNEKEAKIFEKLALRVISGIGEFDNTDRFEGFPKECITEKVLLEAIKKQPLYLNYADKNKETFKKLAEIGYKKELEEQERTELTKQEIELMKKFSEKNATLFTTLRFSSLKPDIVNILGKGNLEIIVRYPNIQARLETISHSKEALNVLNFTIQYLKQDSKYLAPLIQELVESIDKEGSHHTENNIYKSIMEPNEFLKLVSSKIQNNQEPMTEYEKTIISYLVLNPEEANQITNYSDIENFNQKKNIELDGIIENEQSTFIEVKNAYLERTLGINYDKAVELTRKYGSNVQELLEKIQMQEQIADKDRAKIQALEALAKIQEIIKQEDIKQIRNEYREKNVEESKAQIIARYKQAISLETTIRMAYTQDMVQELNSSKNENFTEQIQYTEDGHEYVVRKMNGPFSKMVSVMDAYKTSTAEGDMYDKWNTTKMAERHALCYSYITEENIGTAQRDNTKKLMISIKDFNEQAIVAMAPYDICSDNNEIGTYAGRPEKYYTAKKLPDYTRGLYSEVDIEIQDTSKETGEYKKIQPASIICFEEVDPESIQAAISLSEKSGRKIPIELIDRRELAKVQRDQIDKLLEKFKTEKTIQPELIEQIITKFNNVRNAHFTSDLFQELVGEGTGKFANPDAIFNNVHLNEILHDTIETVKKQIQEGNREEGLKALKQIKQSINAEREKYELLPSMYEKQMMAGISLDIDYSIDEIQRQYGPKTEIQGKPSKSIEILEQSSSLESTTFEAIFKTKQYPAEQGKQLSLDEAKAYLDLQEVKKAFSEIQEKRIL